MTQIDFYILSDNSQRDINQVVCLLCEKALAQKMSVLIYTQLPSQAQEIDDLLWTFKANTFIAHTNQLNHLETQAPFPSSVLISPLKAVDQSDMIFKQYDQLLINLDSNTPPFFQQFERVAELVDKDIEKKAIARDRYRYYHQKGYTLNKYKL